MKSINAVLVLLTTLLVGCASPSVKEPIDSNIYTFTVIKESKVPEKMKMTSLLATTSKGKQWLYLKTSKPIGGHLGVPAAYFEFIIWPEKISEAIETLNYAIQNELGKEIIEVNLGPTKYRIFNKKVADLDITVVFSEYGLLHFEDSDIKEILRLLKEIEKHNSLNGKI